MLCYNSDTTLRRDCSGGSLQHLIEDSINMIYGNSRMGAQPAVVYKVELERVCQDVDFHCRISMDRKGSSKVVVSPSGRRGFHDDHMTLTRLSGGAFFIASTCLDFFRWSWS